MLNWREWLIWRKSKCYKTCGRNWWNRIRGRPQIWSFFTPSNSQCKIICFEYIWGFLWPFYHSGPTSYTDAPLPVTNVWLLSSVASILTSWRQACQLHIATFDSHYYRWRAATKKGEQGWYSREIAGLRAYRDYEKIITNLVCTSKPEMGIPLNYP